MNGMNFAPPPGLKGDERAQLAQVHSFLFRLTEQLNAALAQTDTAIQKAQASATAASGEPVSAAMDTEYRELKSLIVKSADIVRAEMDVIETELSSKYEALSGEWGDYQQTIETKIVQTAESTVESYNYQAQITGVADGLDLFMRESRGYIRRGIIGYDDSGLPVYGIAIGEDIQVNTVEKDGVVYEEIDLSRNMALYTTDRVSFYQNGAEVAWFSNSELNVTRIDVADTVTFNGVWELSRKFGFTLRWIGG